MVLKLFSLCALACVLGTSALTCNQWRTFSAADGVGIPSNSEMSEATCDPDTETACFEAAYTAMVPDGSDNQEPGTSYCSGTCKVQEGGCSTEDDDASCVQSNQMSGNDASMDSGNDDTVLPCPGNILISGHIDPTFNGEYMVQPDQYNSNRQYMNAGGRYLFRYNYTMSLTEYKGWALDDTAPPAVLTPGIRDPTDSTELSKDTEWASGGGEEFTSANSEDVDGNLIVSPVSCTNDCFGDSGDVGAIQMHCVAGSKASRRLSLEERKLRGDVSDVRCHVCTGDKCNTGRTVGLGDNINGALGGASVSALASMLAALATAAAHRGL